MIVEKDVASYLLSLHKEYQTAIETRSSTPELSFRTHLHNFFMSIIPLIKDNVGIIHEPSSTGKGRPDFRLHNTDNFGVYGYIEVKPFEKDVMEWEDHKSQINKYVELGSNVILTDGIDFYLFKGKKTRLESLEIIKKVTLVKSKKVFFDKGYQTDNLSNLEDLITFFSTFLEHTQARRVSKDTLIDLLARRAELIRGDVETLLLRSQKGTDNEGVANNLLGIYDAFKEQLDETLDEETFSSLIGQLLIFSLLVAYTELQNHKKEISDENLKRHFITSYQEHYRPMRALISLMDKVSGQMGIIKAGWSDAALLLSYIKIDANDLGNYHDIYELFHDSYNPEEKMDFGAYATPMELSDYAVSFCEEIINKEFDTNMFAENTRIVDPNCGTGTYLESLIKLAKKRQKKIMSSISGIEILPIPYTLAQMRLNYLSTHLNNDEEKIPKVFLGNSLSNAIVSNMDHTRKITSNDESINLLNSEYNELQESTLPPIMIVLGNPPSSDSGFNMGENFTEIEKALEAFRPPQLKRTSRQNTQKQLQNDFVKFIKWACLKIDETEGGIISFIVPNSTLVDKSYIYMRQYLLNNFNKIYVLEFDADLRKGNVDTENLFNTRQGRAMLVLVKKGQSVLGPNPASSKTYYRSITNLTKEKKIRWFNKGIGGSDYREIDPYGWAKSFIPINVKRSRVETYQTFTSIDQMFYKHVSGVKTGCTALVTHPDYETLKQKLVDYTDELISDEDLYEKYFKGQARVGAFRKGWKRAYVSREVKKVITNDLIRSYDFRPFIKSYVFYSKDVMKEASSGGGRARPELEDIFVNNDYKGNYALALAKSPSLISKNLDQFVCVVEDLPDNDLASRNNSYIFPIHFPDKGNGNIVNNVNQELINQVSKFYKDYKDIDKDQIKNDLILYIYTILSSNYFREEYEDIIYHGLLQGLIRVPITNNKDLFTKTVKIGKVLAQIQLNDRMNSECDKLNISYEFNYRSMELKTVRLQEVKNKIVLIGSNDEKVTFNNIPIEVFNFRVKGYDVLNTWLKYKRFSYLNMKINQGDIDELITLINNIITYLKQLSKSDNIVKDIIDGDIMKLS